MCQKLVMIDKNSIEDLKNRLDIVDVIGNYLELKKSGANFKTTCPFHSEKTPSFVVSPSKQIYHCFGCGAGGDSIKFVMEYEKLSYPEAVEKLAQTYNFPLKYREKSQTKQKNRKILEELNLFFRRNLEKHKKAKEYLKERGVSEAIIEKFEIGYAPSNRLIIDFFKNNFYSIDELKEVGVVAFNENNEAYSRFIERITFPIFSNSNRIVGFGGRTISNHPAKYINSPSTPLFNKSKLLYGFTKAKESIYREREIIITEGYLDVLMLHQVGFTNAVATLGTALTKEHIPLLRKIDAKIILAYDGDRAGREAGFKASLLLSQKGFRGGVVLFPKGVDPADMVKNREINQLKSLFSDVKPFIEFCLEEIANRYNIKNPLEKEEALKEIKNYLKTLTPILQEEYKGFVASLLNINQNLIKTNNRKNQLEEREIKSEDMAELSIIKTLINKPNLIDTFLNILDIKAFQKHREELEILLREEFDNPLLVGISLRNDIKEYNEEELMAQIKFFLIKCYNNELKEIRAKNISFKEKIFEIRKIQNRINKLEKGELLNESFSPL